MGQRLWMQSRTQRGQEGTAAASKTRVPQHFSMALPPKITCSMPRGLAGCICIQPTCRCGSLSGEGLRDISLARSCQEDYAIAGFNKTDKHLSTAPCDHPRVSSNARLLVWQGFARVGNPTGHPGPLATSLAKPQTQVEQEAALIEAVCLWAMQ